MPSFHLLFLLSLLKCLLDSSSFNESVPYIWELGIMFIRCNFNDLICHKIMMTSATIIAGSIGCALTLSSALHIFVFSAALRSRCSFQYFIDEELKLGEFM